MERVTRDIRDDKSRKSRQVWENGKTKALIDFLIGGIWKMVSTIRAYASPKKGTGPGILKCKHSLLTCHTHRK